MLQLFCIFSILTFYYAYTKELENVPGSDFCTRPPVGIPRLEVAFVIDQSSHYVETKYPLLRDIVEFIYKEWPGSKVGVATFSDYPCFIYWPQEGCDTIYSHSYETPFPNGTFEKYHRHPEGCYIFQDALSSDPKPILDRINTNNIEYLASGTIESGFAAVYRTIAEPEMKWTRGINVDDELLRIIFVVSDDETYHAPVGTRLEQEELKGDGTDRCLKNLNPWPWQVGDLMEKDGMAMYMLYADTAFRTGNATLASWTYIVNELQRRNRRFGRINELNSTNYLSEFKLFVKDFKNSRPTPCADPPPYNTLGL